MPCTYFCVRHWVETFSCPKLCKKICVYSVIFANRQTLVCYFSYPGITDKDLMKRESLWFQMSSNTLQAKQGLLSRSQMVKISPKEHSLQLWIFKTLFNKRFKDTEEHSKVNKLHRYITITSARFTLVCYFFFYKKHTKNKIFSLVYHNCTAKEVIYIYIYTHYFNM